MADEQQAFLYDDFFVSEEDPGIEVVLTVRGRDIPLRVASGISLGDQQEVQAMGVKKHFDFKTKQVVVDEVDESLITFELMRRYIKSWPFTFADGSPVPVNRKNIARLGADAAAQLQEVINVQERIRKDAVNGPFVATSDKG